MLKWILFLLFLTTYSCKAQSDYHSTIEFTSNLEEFESLSEFKTALQDVELIALGENTHGLGEVFAAKTDLVKFLHRELGFTLVLFESGFGEGALAWENIDSLSPLEYTQSFTSNFYYHSEEIQELIEYAKNQDNTLAIKGFDCQPKQDYLIKRMTEIVHPVDSGFARTVNRRMGDFNNIYQLEYNKDSIGFYRQRDEFTAFLNTYEVFTKEKRQSLLNSSTTQNELDIINKSIQIFKATYSTINYGDLMGWPNSANIRDKSLFETVKWIKEMNPETKIILWAQNSHIENKPKPNYTVEWMGHSLKATYGSKYYSLGTVVYSGTNLNYNGTFDFEHNNKDYIAYHLNQFKKDKFVFDLRSHATSDFTNQVLLGMENNGNTAGFVAKDRFDGLLFIRYSQIPKLIKKE